MPKIEKTATLVQDISITAEEQESSVNLINESMNQLNETTQTSAASAEELAATSENLLSQTEHVKDAMTFFKFDTAHIAVKGSNKETAPVEDTL